MWIHKRRKPACLRIPQFSNTTDEYYYSLLMLLNHTEMSQNSFKKMKHQEMLL